MKLEFATAVTSIANANVGANPGGINVAATPVWSSDKKTLTYQFTAASKPTLYVATIFFMINGGEVRWDLPTDANFAAVCSSGPTDVVKPVMGAASVVGSPTSVSANLLLAATDDITSPVTSFVANDAANGITNMAITANASGNATVTGLTASTSYNLIIKAKDAAGNISDNSTTVSFSTSAGLTTSAPTPTVASAQVKSIFSDAYTGAAAVTGLNLNPNWGQATVQSVIQLGSDNVLRYVNLNWQGTEFANIYPVASGMKYLHIDIWTETETRVDVFPICRNAANTANEAEKYKRITLEPTDMGVWKSYDIPLTDYTSQGLTMQNVYQLKIVGTGGKTVYLDNIYFWTDVAPSLVVSAATLAVAQPANSTNTFDITTTSGWTVASDQTWLTPSTTSGSGNATVTLTATTENDTYFSRTATVTISGSGTTKTIAVTQAPLLPTGLTPSTPSDKVKSIYSDAYTPAVTVSNFDSWWNMSFSDVTFAPGNTGKRVVTTAPGNCGSPTFTNTPLDVTDMTHVHVDVFPLSTMDVGIQFITVTPTTANWFL
jgi:hypothetical protein